MIDLPDYDNYQKWANSLKTHPISKIWRILPIILGTCVYMQFNAFNKLNNEYQKLKENILPIRELYPKLELSGAVAKLLQDYEIIKLTQSKLEANSENDKRYSYISQLSVSGDHQLGGGTATPTSISDLFGDLNIKIAYQPGNAPSQHTYSVNVECGNEYIAKYKEIIEKAPEFPFTYGALAICAYRNNDLDKFSFYREKAIEILKITSSYSGAYIDHAAMLDCLEKFDKTEKTVSEVGN